MTAEPEPSGHDLPAPYRSPWRRLVEDLGDAMADLRLRGQELIRRNREGSLPLPSWWPPALASGFWPLLLAAILAAAIALVAALFTAPLTAPLSVPGRSGLQPPAGALPAVRPPSPGDGPRSSPVAGSTALAPLGGTADAGPTRAEPESPSAPAAAPAPPAPTTQPSPAPASAAPTPADGAASADADAGDNGVSVADADALSALRRALAQADPDRLIVGLRSDGATATLRLELADRFARLAVPERRRLALAWQSQAAELAYERLELRDRQGRLLGRSARVGAGMVLLQPAA